MVHSKATLLECFLSFMSHRHRRPCSFDPNSTGLISCTNTLYFHSHGLRFQLCSIIAFFFQTLNILRFPFQCSTSQESVLSNKLLGLSHLYDYLSACSFLGLVIVLVSLCISPFLLPHSFFVISHANEKMCLKSQFFFQILFKVTHYKSSFIKETYVTLLPLN